MDHANDFDHAILRNKIEWQAVIGLSDRHLDGFEPWLAPSCVIPLASDYHSYREETKPVGATIPDSEVRFDMAR
jgi:hypothetical protein